MRENAQEPPQYFNLEDVDNNDCTSLFRFEKNDLYQLCEALRLPEFITTYNQNKVSGRTGLCMLLRRLVYPNRLSDLQGLFGYSPQTISMVTRHVTDILMQNHGHLLSNLEQLPWLNHQRLELYAQAIHNKGAPMHNCWGFIDGTARAICRPTVSQEDYYSGHKRCHCVKYRSVLCPDGIIASLKGGWPGRRHDAAMFTESNLYNELERMAVFPNEDKYILYGDQAYGIRELLWTPYTNRINIEPHQQEFNNLMRRLRLTVEWGFQKTITKFAFLDFKKNQKLLLQDVESMYKVGVLLTNCHTTLYGSQTSQYFNIVPVGLAEYIG
ncbi:unnamed protein product [Callosobruchus maculatus]|uniref:DDE Tnp4 domain-containing protein n=1 Tax=Callosobruchus maculatus TaxID=64391 RepID=A0A653C1Q5_CALMS|nr:unnamed protein product [Callosobruchus maculatus]